MMLFVYELIYCFEMMCVGVSEYLMLFLKQFIKFYVMVCLGIEVDVYFDDFEFDFDCVILFVFIVNEFVLNSFEYVFGDCFDVCGWVSVLLCVDFEVVIFEVVDDGFGIFEEIDW